MLDVLFKIDKGNLRLLGYQIIKASIFNYEYVAFSHN
jgi:hypothetical protein